MRGNKKGMGHNLYYNQFQGDDYDSAQRGERSGRGKEGELTGDLDSLV